LSLPPAPRQAVRPVRCARALPTLHVTTRGSKLWRFRYRFRHAEKMISLGVYPNVSLAEARRLHTDARGLLARGIDPSVERGERRATRPTDVRGRCPVVVERCSRVFRHAIGLGYVSRDIIEGLRGLLEPPHVRHRSTIADPRRLGELLRGMGAYKGRRITGIALRLVGINGSEPPFLSFEKHAFTGDGERVNTFTLAPSVIGQNCPRASENA
jgi:hypothetical protein